MVECQFPKLEVAGSKPVYRSKVGFSAIRWWTHSEEFDWKEWDRGEKARWLTTPVEEKKLELLDQKIADGRTDFTGEELKMMEES